MAEVVEAEAASERAAEERMAWAQPRGVGIDPGRLRRMQLEALALHDAAAAAVAHVASVSRRRDAVREQWVQARSELKAVQRLAEHRAAIAAAEAASRAQAAADELALLAREDDR